MDGSPSRRSSACPSLWRDGGLHRVMAGAAVGFAGGATFAAARSLPTPAVLRAGVACSFFVTPFFALREVVAAGVGVDGPVASTIAGGFAGYFGALFVSGPHWKAVSHGAMVVGVSCGFMDVIISGLDWRRKMYIVSRHEAAVVAAAAAVERKKHSAESTLCNTEVRVMRRDMPPWWLKWPIWFPVFKEIDEEYQELLRRQEATVLALEEEQARIAQLLEALESVKAGRPVLDAELAEGHKGERSHQEERNQHTGLVQHNNIHVIKPALQAVDHR